MTKPYIVELEQTVLLPGRSKPDPFSRLFHIEATTERNARKAVRDAGYRGRIISVCLEPGYKRSYSAHH